MKKKVFPRHTVNLSKEAFNASIKIIKDNRIFDGPQIKEFEENFARYHKVKYARGVFSARSGLVLVLKALRFQDGEEIILSAFNYYEIPRIIKLCNLKPVFVDVHPRTFNIDTSQIEKYITGKSRAILVTHACGQPCDMHPIMDIAKKYNLKVIEDCSHACGAEYKGQKVGTFGDAGIFSFAIGKNMPCFGAGAVITNNDSLWQEMDAVFKQYIHPSIYDFLKIFFIHLVGFFFTYPKIFPYTLYPVLRILDVFNITLSSYHENIKITLDGTIRRYERRMLNLQAAVDLKQLERLDAINKKLRENALSYYAFFKENRIIQAPLEIPEAKHIYLYYCFTVKNREIFRKILLRKGVDIEKSHLYNCPAFKVFSNATDSFAATKILSEESIDLPNNIYLTEDDIKYIACCACEAARDISR